MADWVTIRADYVSGGGSFRVLAEKYGISVSSIKKKAAAEEWTANRTKLEPQLYQKTVRKVLEQKSDQNADRLTRILALSDTLLSKAEIAAAELTQHVVRNKHRERVIEYDAEDGKGRPYPTRETISDTEQIDFGIGPIDRMGLKQVASALKDLRDVAATPNTDEQSLSKIAEMMARLDKEAGADGVPEPETGGVSA